MDGYFVIWASHHQQGQEGGGGPPQHGWQLLKHSMEVFWGNAHPTVPNGVTDPILTHILVGETVPAKSGPLVDGEGAGEDPEGRPDSGVLQAGQTEEGRSCPTSWGRMRSGMGASVWSLSAPPVFLDCS